MLAGQTYILCGLSRLTLRVARRLTANRAQVIVVQMSRSGDRLRGLIDDGAQVIDAADREDMAEVLRGVGIGNAHCLLALSEDDLDNLRAAVAAREVAPDLPVVLRAFDPALAEGLEHGLNIRRAYSVSALAAPAFVAAACGDRVVETLRLGDGEVPICEVIVRPHSPLNNLMPQEVDERFGCCVLARRGSGEWQIAEPGQPGPPLTAGESALIGGLLPNVLALVGRNAALAAPHGTGQAHKRVKRKRAFHGKRFGPRHTLLPVVAFSLGALLVVSVIVFAIALRLSIADAIYFVITTATTTGYGDISLKDSPDWLKLFGNVIMVSGGALFGVLFSYLSAITTTERLEERMGRQASRMRGHVVVAGLGNVGYRMVRQLADMGWNVAAIELAENARFVEALREQVPVLVGDARLPENLERAGVDQAAAFIACTNDDLANIQACLHARRLNSSIRTVARMYEDPLAERLTTAFQIDEALSASQVAAGAFFGAATDERAMRPVKSGDLDLLACRLTIDRENASLDRWTAESVQAIAVYRRDGSLLPPREAIQSLAAGDQVILCGPAAAVREIMTGQREPRNQTGSDLSNKVVARKT
jgi:Trk K+ transport system NAD-binding subunit